MTKDYKAIGKVGAYHCTSRKWKNRLRAASHRSARYAGKLALRVTG